MGVWRRGIRARVYKGLESGVEGLLLGLRVGV